MIYNVDNELTRKNRVGHFKIMRRQHDVNNNNSISGHILGCKIDGSGWPGGPPPFVKPQELIPITTMVVD